MQGCAWRPHDGQGRAPGRSPRKAEVTPDGLDLELRVWKLRIEFPWLKSLPVRPGRPIVISIFEAPAATN